MQHPFKLKNAALLMALAAIYPVAAHSAAGVAQFAVGDVSVRRGAASIPLAKGQAIDSGDNIVTGTSGQTQIRFTDGGLVSLTPNSQFNINKYVDDNDPGKDSFAVSFLRGGMRAITGLIGKRNRDNYKVTTNTATIGIRGSAFSARHNTDGSLDVAGEQDAIEVCTNAGCVSVIVGEIVRVTGSDTLPTRTALRSNVPPLVARSDLFNPENPANIALLELPNLFTGELGGVSAMFAFGTDSIDTYPRGGQDPSGGAANFAAGQMVAHLGSSAPYSGFSQLVEKTSTAAGSFGFVGAATDPGFIGWGYWDEGSVTSPDYQQEARFSESSSLLQGVHYIVGKPTPLAQMPVTGAARYSLLGGTSPTAYDGETLRVGSLLDASLTVNFSSQRVSGQISTSFIVDGESHAVLVYNVAGLDGAAFRSDGCGNGFFNGFFTGNQASRAGLVYGAYDSTVGDVRGAAVLVTAGSGLTGLSAGFASTDGNYFDYYSPRGGPAPSTGTGFFSGNQLLAHDDGEDFYSTSLWVAQGGASSFGALGSVGDADFIGWGYWGNASYNNTSHSAGVHHVVGRPTPVAQMPQSGTAKYDLAGATAPTAYLSGTVLTGQLLSAGLNVDFGDGSVNAFFNTRFTKTNGQVVPVQIAGVGSISSGYDGETYVNSSTFYSDDYNSGHFSGFFVGNNATRAGVIYQAEDGQVGDVRGAAVFQKNGTGDNFGSRAGMGAMFASGDGFVYDSAVRPGSSYGGSAFFIGNNLFDHDDQSTSYGGSSYLFTRSPVTNSGSLGTPADTDFIGWGYWAKGQSTGAVHNGAVTDVHYLVGRPTPNAQMPVTGSANYTLVNGTRPTATDNAGATIFGTLTGATLTAHFGSGFVDATINTQFTKSNGTVVPVSISDLANISGSRFTSVGCGNGTIQGFFTGSQAARAGLTYGRDGTDVGRVRGAAVFTKGTAVVD